jgi:hypothetical protein
MDMKDEEAPKDNVDEVVLKALQAEPRFELPLGFADRLVAMVELRIALKEARRDRWWLAGGIVSIVIALVYAFTMVSFKPGVGVFTFFSGYKGLVIFGVLFVVALHLVDKFLLRKNKGLENTGNTGIGEDTR